MRGGGSRPPQSGGGGTPHLNPVQPSYIGPSLLESKKYFFRCFVPKKRAKYRGNPFWGPWGRGVRQAHSPYPLWGSSLQKKIPGPTAIHNFFGFAYQCGMWWLPGVEARPSTAPLCCACPIPSEGHSLRQCSQK